VGSKSLTSQFDLPEASVQFRFQEHRSRPRGARAGRLLRPKADGGGAISTLGGPDSLDAEYAAHRQRFLAEQATATSSATPTTYWTSDLERRAVAKAPFRHEIGGFATAPLYDRMVRTRYQVRRRPVPDNDPRVAGT